VALATPIVGRPPSTATASPAFGRIGNRISANRGGSSRRWDTAVIAPNRSARAAPAGGCTTRSARPLLGGRGSCRAGSVSIVMATQIICGLAARQEPRPPVPFANHVVHPPRDREPERKSGADRMVNLDPVGHLSIHARCGRPNGCRHEHDHSWPRRHLPGSDEETVIAARRKGGREYSQPLGRSGPPKKVVSDVWSMARTAGLFAA